MTEQHVTRAETISLLLRLADQLEAADELADAAQGVLGVMALHTRRRLRFAVERYQAAKTP